MHLSTDDGENSNSQNNIWLKSIPEATTGGDLWTNVIKSMTQLPDKPVTLDRVHRVQGSRVGPQAPEGCSRVHFYTIKRGNRVLGMVQGPSELQWSHVPYAHGPIQTRSRYVGYTLPTPGNHKELESRIQLGPSLPTSLHSILMRSSQTFLPFWKHKRFQFLTEWPIGEHRQPTSPASQNRNNPADSGLVQCRGALQWRIRCYINHSSYLKVQGFSLPNDWLSLSLSCLIMELTFLLYYSNAFW